MDFHSAIKQGNLDSARASLDELVNKPDTGGLYLPECYSDLAQSYKRASRYDEAIAAMERALEVGWSGRPHGRSDIAEIHLRAGRDEEAARIWAELKELTPDDVWLYNAAGLSYHEAGEHEAAVDWLADGLELAMRTGDPEGIVAQLSGVRRASLEALGRPLDALEQRVDPFLAQWRERERQSRASAHRSSPDEGEDDVGWARVAGGVALALAWFPASDYTLALERWESLAEDWRAVPHPEYCRRMEGHMKWLRAHGAPVRAVAPLALDAFEAWCEERTEAPEDARAAYAADLFRQGGAIEWPPGRNDACWCGSQRKYKKCCGPAPAALMHGPTDD